MSLHGIGALKYVPGNNTDVETSWRLHFMGHALQGWQHEGCYWSVAHPDQWAEKPPEVKSQGHLSMAMSVTQASLVPTWRHLYIMMQDVRKWKHLQVMDAAFVKTKMGSLYFWIPCSLS